MPPKQLTLTELLFTKTSSTSRKGGVRLVKSVCHNSSNCSDEGESPERKRRCSALNCQTVVEGKAREDLSPLPAANSQNREEEGMQILSATNSEQNLKKASWPSPDLSQFFCSLLEPSWRELLHSELQREYAKKIHQFLAKLSLKDVNVFPPRDLIFNAFNLTPFSDIRVVLIGQDPYHNLRQAHGLCFSVPRGVPPPPSLKNIYKELASDFSGFKTPDHGDLTGWARQGVFLLNATLTVEAHKANSHKDIGWQKFTDAVIKLISANSEQGVVFLLWGGFAHTKEKLVDKRRHRVIKTAHPSPLSATKFFGCKCFSRANSLLEELGREPVDWSGALR